MTAVYHPLDRSRREIRLIASVDLVHGQVCCQLETVCLAREVHYKTISWCWGDQSVETQISVNGNALVVRGNVERVLRWLHSKGYRRVWLDAICINQLDLDERANQITLMKEIYSNSAQTLVILDLEADKTTSEAACSAIRSVLDEAREKTDGFRDFDMTVYSGENGTQHVELPLSPALDMHAVCTFFASPWFTRVWIIQEVVLSKDVVCYFGTVTLAWSDVRYAAQWLEYRSYWKHLDSAHEGTVGIDNCALLSGKAARLGQKDTWWEYVSISRMFKSTDPRDKVYGMLGLRHMHEKSVPIEPDYNKSVVDVYVEVTRGLIMEHDSLHAILPANSLDPLPGACEETFPSWVPRYDYWFVREARSARDITMDPIIGAANGLKAKVYASADKILAVDGIVVDTVAATSAALSSSLLQDIGSFVTEMLYIWHLTAIAGKIRPQNLHHVLMDVLTIGCWSAELGLSEDTLYDKFGGFLGALGLDGAAANMHDFHSVKKSIWLWSVNRVFFITHTGYIGMGPRDTALADEVVVLLGSRVPCILRPCGEKLHTFIGSTYVKGLMEGQLIRTLQAQRALDKELVRFDIQ